VAIPSPDCPFPTQSSILSCSVGTSVFSNVAAETILRTCILLRSVLIYCTWNTLHGRVNTESWNSPIAVSFGHLECLLFSFHLDRPRYTLIKPCHRNPFIKIRMGIIVFFNSTINFDVFRTFTKTQENTQCMAVSMILNFFVGVLSEVDCGGMRQSCRRAKSCSQRIPSTAAVTASRNFVYPGPIKYVLNP